MDHLADMNHLRFTMVNPEQMAKISADRFAWPVEVIWEHMGMGLGEFTQDLPGSDASPNRKKGARAYLAVHRSRETNKTGFLWCDADEKPADKTYIKLDDYFVMADFKKELVEDYNRTVKELNDKHNNHCRLVHMRHTIVKLARERGLDELPGIELKGDIKDHVKKVVFATVNDPMLN